jgi:glucose-1-phosphate cytidylyltransferase
MSRTKHTSRKNKVSPPEHKDIPVVIFCGGRGTRLKEETEVLPKPMVRIGERPILWHIMKIYYAQGFRNFVLLLGYKGEKIKEYFCNYMLHTSDFTLESRKGGTKHTYHSSPSEDWKITFVETGLNTQTGGRLKRAQKYIKSRTFMLTYGDGVADIDLSQLLETHRSKGRVATMSGVIPPGRFGEVLRDEGDIIGFNEKPTRSDVLINGGFFAVDQKVFDELSEDVSLEFEKHVLPELAKQKKLAVYPHGGYWQCMDTVRDMEVLNSEWHSGSAYWKVWQ